MKLFYTKLFCTLLLSAFIFPAVNAQIVINEFCSSNGGFIGDENGDAADWLELYNGTGGTANLRNYGLSDDVTNLYKLTFPSVTIPANGHMLVFCDGHNNSTPVDHWETPIKNTATWKYFAGTSQPDTNWRNNSFTETGWSTGTPTANRGFGFFNGDDSYTISASAISVMVRSHLNLSSADINNIAKCIFNIDYDDGFVAYLNGVEIARSNCGVQGDRPTYNVYALLSHQAELYQGAGHVPDSFYIDPVKLKSILIAGDNVLAVEVHNQNASNDMSCIPFLSFGVQSTTTVWAGGSLPAWFTVPQKEYIHANFKISNVGGSVYLTNDVGVIIDQKTYTTMGVDNSYGRQTDGDPVNWCTFSPPTPKSANAGFCYSGYASIPLFNPPPGFYPVAQTCTLTTSQTGGTIRYSIDGSDPTATSTLYSAPFPVDTTIVVRAKVFASGLLPSATISNTYFIGKNIHLPIFTINTSPYNLFNTDSGIYVVGHGDSTVSPCRDCNYWLDWERPAAIEYYDKDKNRIARFGADINIAGNYSQGYPQKSFEIKLSGKYGQSSLQYSFFPAKPWVNNTDDLVLRNAGTDNNKLHYRDHLMEKIMAGTNVDYIAQEPVVVFLNGQFWGVYQIVENDNRKFVEYNYGIGKDKIDFLKEGGAVETTCGSDTGFFNMVNFATTTSTSGSTYYNNMNHLLDMNNFADYFIAETYYCNEDWMGSGAADDWTNNIVMWRPNNPIGRWKYLLKDLDFGLGLSSRSYHDILGVVLNPIAQSSTNDLFRAVITNPQFKNYFINRYADLINTKFLPANMIPELLSIHDSMASDMTQHFTRWGMTLLTWNTEYNKARDFINQRPDTARGFIKSNFALTAKVTLTLNVIPAGAGRIQISTITPGPLPWSGVYFNGNPVTVTAIPNPGYTFDHFNSTAFGNNTNQSINYNYTANSTIIAYFTGSPATPLITLSEINYHSYDSVIYDGGDWAELHNYGTVDVDISGWKFKDGQDNHQFIFPANTVIVAGGYLVVADDTTKFKTLYPAVANFTGPFNHNFNNSTENLRLFDYNDNLYFSAQYFDQLPWPLPPDGQGYTLELISPTGDLNDPANWFSGCFLGSPGREYAAPTAVITGSGALNFCVGSSVDLNANVVSGYTYQWQKNHVDSGGATSSTLTVSESGVYTVAVSYQNCTTISDSFVVNVIPFGIPPVPTTNFNCGTGTVSLTATGDSVFWYDNIGGNLVGTGNNFTTQTISTTTAYYVQSGSLCPSAYVAVDATIAPVSPAPVAIDGMNCGAGIVALSSTGDSISWYDNIGGNFLISGNDYTTPVISGTAIYYVQSGTFCPSAFVPVVATINTVSADPVTTNSSNCGTGDVTVSATAADIINWYDAPVGGNFLGTGTSFTLLAINSDSIIYAIAGTTCPSNPIAVTATINPISADPVGADSARCGTGDVTVTASATDIINWYDAPVGGNFLGTGTSLLLSGINSDSTVYAIAGTTCPSNPIAVNATINIVAADPVVTNGANCGAGDVTLTATAADVINWYDAPVGGNFLGTGNSFTLLSINSDSTIYAIAGTPCPSNPIAATATINPLPIINLGNDTMIQSGQQVILDAGAGYITYIWSTLESTQTITVNYTDTFIVVVTGTGNCTGTDSIVVTVDVGFKEFSSDENCIVFPNPTHGDINLSINIPASEKFLLMMTDVTGRELLRDEIEVREKFNQKIDVSRFAKGIYILSLESKNSRHRFKITVE